jgi:hypothetical protein
MNSALGSAPYYLGIDKVLAVTLSTDPGNTKKARDWSQYTGITRGGNTHWKKSCIWIQSARDLYIWLGSGLTVTEGKIVVYRTSAPLYTGDFESAGGIKIDLLDKYVPLVIAKSALWAMKQSKMGDYQEVEGTVNEGIKSIQAEYSNSLNMAASKPKFEAIEGV